MQIRSKRRHNPSRYTSRDSQTNGLATFCYSASSIILTCWTVSLFVPSEMAGELAGSHARASTLEMQRCARNEAEMQQWLEARQQALPPLSHPVLQVAWDQRFYHWQKSCPRLVSGTQRNTLTTTRREAQLQHRLPCGFCVDLELATHPVVKP